MQTPVIRSGASGGATPRNYNNAPAAASALPAASIQELKEIAEQIKMVCEIFGLSGDEERHMRKAFLMSTIQNGLVPDSFKGDYRSIYVMSIKAERMGISLAETLQGGYFVHGRHAWYAEFMIARVLELKIFSKIDYEEGGSLDDDSLWCRAVGTRPDGSTVPGAMVDMKMARKEGWIEKKGSKWSTMPAYMLQKRAATFLIRATAAHVFGGSSETVDEAEEQQATAQNPQVIDTRTSAVETMQNIVHAEEKKAEEQSKHDLLRMIKAKITELKNGGVQESDILTELNIVSVDDMDFFGHDQLMAVMEVLSDAVPPPPKDAEKQEFDNDIEKLRLQKLEELKAFCVKNKITNAVVLEKTGMPASMVERATLPELVKALKALQ